MRLNALGKLRRALQAVDIQITRRNYRLDYFRPPEESAEIVRWKSFFLQLDTAPGANGYLGTHLDRLSVPTEAEALAAYTSAGTPGNVDVGALRQRLAEAAGTGSDLDASPAQ